MIEHREVIRQQGMAGRAELMLVDASLGQRAALHRVLTAHGFSVTAFPALRQAGAALASQPFDHAVLDLRLPD